MCSVYCPTRRFGNRVAVDGVLFDFLAGEVFAGHCQLVEGSAFLPREMDAPDRSQQAHVTASHSTNARVRSRRW